MAVSRNTSALARCRRDYTFYRAMALLFRIALVEWPSSQSQPGRNKIEAMGESIAQEKLQMEEALADFLSRFAGYKSTSLLDHFRATEYRRLDESQPRIS